MSPKADTTDASRERFRQIDKLFDGQRTGHTLDLDRLVMPSGDLIVRHVPIGALIGLASRHADQHGPIGQMIRNPIPTRYVKQQAFMLGHQDRSVNHEHPLVRCGENVRERALGDEAEHLLAVLPVECAVRVH